MKFIVSEEFLLVYWPNEEGVSVVSRNAIVMPGADNLVVDSECRVRVGKEVYAGKVAALGKEAYICTVFAYCN